MLIKMSSDVILMVVIWLCMGVYGVEAVECEVGPPQTSFMTCDMCIVHIQRGITFKVKLYSQYSFCRVRKKNSCEPENVMKIFRQELVQTYRNSSNIVRGRKIIIFGHPHYLI